MGNNSIFSDLIYELRELWIATPYNKVEKPWGYSYERTAEHKLIEGIIDHLELYNF